MSANAVLRARHAGHRLCHRHLYTRLHPSALSVICVACRYKPIECQNDKGFYFSSNHSQTHSGQNGAIFFFVYDDKPE